MYYTKKSFTLPATESPKKTPCTIHHIVKGQCLRCPHKVTGRAEITDEGKAALKETE